MSSSGGPFATRHPAPNQCSNRYTHRVAISNRRLVAADDEAIAFRWKDYRVNGPDRWKTMRLHPHEFIRRFLRHVLPKGFHRIRHYGLFASTTRAESIATARAHSSMSLRLPPIPNKGRMSRRIPRVYFRAHAPAVARA